MAGPGGKRYEPTRAGLDGNLHRSMNLAYAVRRPGSLGRRILSLSILGLLLALGPGSPAVTLAFLGDVMLGRGVASAHVGGDWDTALAALAPTLTAADLALANLESPLTRAPLQFEAARFDLRAPPEAGRALASAGLDLLSLENNHTLESGEAGLADTWAALDDWGLEGVGFQYGPTWRTVGGLRLAFLAFEDITKPLDADAAGQAVSAARAGGALVVVSIHWGAEYQAAPNQRQRFLAQALADAGAAMIVGHHPHVLQPLEWVQGEGQEQPALVAYSLGNALFDQQATADTRRGAVLLVQVGRDGVRRVQALPFEIDPRRGRVLPSSPEAAEFVFHRLGPLAENMLP